MRGSAFAAEPGAAAEATSIRVLPGGPLLISGAFDVVGEDGAPLRCGTKAALCRCGKTGNAPFCNGAHSVGPG